MSGPLVSIIIPTFNREKVIGQAIDSALGQTYSHIEILVIDDGSRDGTRPILESYGNRIRAIYQENAGPSAARNRGLGEARGDIIAFLDSDDRWLPSKLEKQVSLMEEIGPEAPCCLGNIWLPHRPAGFESSFGLADLNSPYPQGIWWNPTEVLVTRFVLLNQAVAVRRWALEKAGNFKVNLRLLEDYDLSLRLSMLGPWGFIQDPLVEYGVSQANSLSRWGDAEADRVPRVMLQVLSQLLTSGTITNPRILRFLHGEIRCCRWLIAAAEYSRKRGPFSALAAGVLRRCVRVRNGSFRRTPFWPKMSTSPLRRLGSLGRDVSSPDLAAGRIG